MRSWFRCRLGELDAISTHEFVQALGERVDAIVAALALRAGQQGLAITKDSIASWMTTVALARQAARTLLSLIPESAAWSIGFEFELPRRARRVDLVLLARDLIFVIEVKAGAARHDRAAIWQAEQYALDLRDFHDGSRGRTIVPILVATESAATRSNSLSDNGDLVQPVQLTSRGDLGDCIVEAFRSLSVEGARPVIEKEWEESAYRPTPSIVDAARELYETHDVREISAADADNLHATVDAVVELVEHCRASAKRGIAFITGSPGSGKTLAGLQVVHDERLSSREETAGVFLSGNMPLVEVISEALARSPDPTTTRAHRRRRVSAFIQHAYIFRNEYAEHAERLPHEHVVLFDEAQRAWDAEQVARWTKGNSVRSEPQILLDVMSRLPEWSVIIAMVGGGQEINRGEAGLAEWGRALAEHHADWLVRASPAVLPGSPDRPGGRLFDVIPDDMEVAEDSRLHLSMNVRSPRAERLNEWVDALLALDVQRARDFVPDGREFPLAVTRNLDAARQWLLDRTDVDQRCGLVANAGARRLRAWGLDTNVLKQERAWAHWFLQPRGDVRSSYQLEVPATNFDCQGLEVDWVGVCWGNDFALSGDGTDWMVRSFSGSRWQATGAERARYVMNSYRVLLTRARRGQVIWVPDPDGLWRSADDAYQDATLEPELFEGVYELLLASGVRPLE